MLPYQPTDPVTVEFVDRRIVDLPGDPQLSRRVRELTRLVGRRWRETGDSAWLDCLERLVLQIDRLPRRVIVASEYWSWFRSWWRDQEARLVRDMLVADGRALPAWKRQAARRSLATAERNVRRAGTADQAHLWRERAARYRKRLLDDCAARWAAGRQATDGNLLRAARRAREEALALGWTP